jgi:hypothetical protein
VVVVAPGNYGDQTIQADASKDGEVPAVTLQAATPGSVTLTDLLSYASNVRYSGFVVDPSGNGQPDIRGGHDVVVENVKATNFYVMGAVSNVTILGGEYGPYPSCGGGSHIKANDVAERDPALLPRNIVVDGVTFRDYTVPSNCPSAHLDCLHIFSSIAVTVRNSKFMRCKHYGILLNSNYAGNRDGHVIENNVFGSAEVAGFALRGGDGEDFEDVLVRYNSGGSITPQTTNVLTNVRWIANAASDLGQCRQGITYAYNVMASGGCGASDVRAAPGFVNPAAEDFHLRSGAAAIDRGDPAAFPALDHDGLMRPAGRAPDAGAMEFGSRPPTSTPPPPAGGAAPAPTRVTFSFLRARLRASRSGRIGLRVRCVVLAATRCRVTLRLTARLPGQRRSHTIARVTRTIRTTGPVTVHLRLSPSIRRVLARGRAVRVNVTARLRTPAGSTTTTGRRMTVRRG